MMMADECSTLSRSGNLEEYRKAVTLTRSTVASSRDSKEVRFTVLSDEAPLECTEPTKSVPSSDSIPPERNFVEAEEIYAVQTCYNSLEFMRPREEGRSRSASFSLPSSSDVEDGCHHGPGSIMWRFNFGRRGGAFPRCRKMPMEEYKNAVREERVWNFSKTKREVLTETVPEHERTSIMLRCIPKEYTRDDILDLLTQYGFVNDINFIYLPANFKRWKNAGNHYCFINFRFPQDALEFKSVFTGLVFSDTNPEEKCFVEWRNPIQGFASHFDRYQNSFRTRDPHLSYFRPTLMRNGKEIPFPEPWEKVKECHRLKKKIAAGWKQIPHSNRNTVGRSR